MKDSYLLRLTNELKEELKKVAIGKGISLNALIVSILWEFVKKERSKKCKN